MVSSYNIRVCSSMHVHIQSLFTTARREIFYQDAHVLRGGRHDSSPSAIPLFSKEKAELIVAPSRDFESRCLSKRRRFLIGPEQSVIRSICILRRVSRSFVQPERHVSLKNTSALLIVSRKCTYTCKCMYSVIYLAFGKRKKSHKKEVKKSGMCLFPSCYQSISQFFELTILQFSIPLYISCVLSDNCHNDN